MLTRLVSLLLVLTLLWAGFATPAAAAVAAPQGIEQRAPTGSADDTLPGEHPLEDQRTPAAAEGVADLPALMPVHAGPAHAPLTMARPHPHAPAPWLAPHLAGPQRPPCPVSFTA